MGMRREQLNVKRMLFAATIMFGVAGFLADKVATGSVLVWVLATAGLVAPLLLLGYLGRRRCRLSGRLEIIKSAHRKRPSRPVGASSL